MTAAIEARSLTKRYGPVTALDGVSLSIEQGAITGLLGRNGAGKTVLMSLITAHETPTSGAVRLLGEDPRENERVLGQTCFIRDNQRYPDEFRLSHILATGARFYPGWDSALAERVVDTFELPGNRDIRKLSRADAVLRSPAARLHRASPHHRRVHPPDRRDREPAQPGHRAGPRPGA